MLLNDVWARLRAVRTLRFTTASLQAGGSKTLGWTENRSSGAGLVTVEPSGEEALTFHERGTWTTGAGISLTFRNVYRWTRGPASLTLEHLRQGPDAPVRLGTLAPAGSGILRLTAPHRCGADVYSAELHVTGPEMHLAWTVTGPQKNDRIKTWYD